MAGNPAFHRAPDSVDESEFEGEAARAVAILAEIRKEEKRANAERQNQRREK